jgi:FKBP12-rapamycin complex-associated protein
MQDTAPEVLQHYELSTRLDGGWYKAWHAWALANAEVVAHVCRVQQQAEDQSDLSPTIVHDHLVPAITCAQTSIGWRWNTDSSEAFFRSIALSAGNALQDTLRLLTIWFKHGEREEVSDAVTEGLGTVNIDTWLEVIPQLIARIYARGEHGYVRRAVQHLLATVGRAHPQALVYPLTVASKYDNIPRQQAALNIIEKMSEHSATLVSQVRQTGRHSGRANPVAGTLSQQRARPRLQSMARAMARGPRGGLAAVLLREQCPGDAQQA